MTDADFERLENKVDTMIDMMKTVMGLSGKSRLTTVERNAMVEASVLKFHQKQAKKEHERAKVKGERKFI